ncbi:MAG: hypothetical protein H0W86_06330, partial [Armatimonadetes bacterium]|nr:hypothetical protein [Armatimonadota bacterium]
KAELLRVKLLLPWIPERRAYDVRGDGGDLVVQRYKDGSWSFQDVVPIPKDEEPAETAYVIEAKDTRIVFRDWFVKRPQEWRCAFTDFSAAGTEDGATVDFDGLVEGVGQVSGVLDATTVDVQFVQLQSPKLSIMPLKKYFAQWKNLREVDWLHSWTASDVHYAGALTIQPMLKDGKAEWRVRGDGSVDASKVIAFKRRFDTAHFEGAFTERLATGDFAATGTGVRGRATGTVRYSPDLAGQLEGEIFAANESTARRYAGELIPRDLSFRNANYSGKLGFGDRMLAAGNVKATSASFQDYQALNVRSVVVSDGKTLRLSGLKGNLLGAAARSELMVLLGDKPTVKGYLVADNVDVTKLPGVPGDTVLRGVADLQVVFGGSASKPTATLRASGDALVAFKLDDERHRERVDFRLTGNLKEGRLFVTAAEVAGQSGLLRGRGSVSLDGRKLDLKVAANAIDLGSLPGSTVNGVAYGDITVKGSAANPVVTGLVEAYSVNIEEYSLPFFSANLGYKNRVLSARGFEARSGVTLITGDASVDFNRNSSLQGSGKIEDLGVGEFTQDQIMGLATGSWTLGGTTADPNVAAELTADSLLADRIEINNAQATGHWWGGELTIDKVTANVGTGLLEVTGGWSRTKDSQIVANLADVPASIFEPYLEGGASIEGLLTGKAMASFRDGKLATGVGSVQARDLVLNGEPVGGGYLSAEVAGRKVHFDGGSGGIGEGAGGDTYVVVENGSYDLDSKELTASLYASNLSVKDASRIASAAFKDQLSFEVREELKKLDGTFTLSAKEITANKLETKWDVASGTLDFSAAGLKYEGREMGQAEALVKKEGDLYVFEKARLFDGPASFRLSETNQNFIDENGQLVLDGEFYNIELKWLKNIDPTLEGLTGTASFSFVAEGEARSPLITASIDTDNVKWGEFPVDIMTNPLYIREGVISGTSWDTKAPSSDIVGSVELRDLRATLEELSIPFHYPGSIPRNETIFARIQVPNTPISDVSEFFGVVADQTQGTLDGGELVVSGTLDALDVRGTVSASADQIKFKGLDTPLVGASAKVQLEGPILKLLASADSSFATPLGSAPGLLLEAYVDLNEWKFLPVGTQADSHLRFTNFAVKQGFGTETVTQGTVSADLGITGDVFKPVVAGDISLSDVALDVAGQFPETTTAANLPVDPLFDVTLQIVSSRISSGPLDAQATGSGEVKGRWSNLNAELALQLDAGDVTLPTGRIRFERGGTADFKYSKDWRGDTNATLLVDLNATTRITADAGFGTQRYTVDMRISGDLLSEESLRIDAVSDPPDLSQSQILAILGQKQLFENVAAAGFGDFNSQIKNILASVAAPALLSHITQPLEEALGLDYLALDFSPAGVGGITIAKSLGNGFTLEYRRVLEQFALTGESLEEIRLNYRLPSSNPILGRLALGVAATRDGLLKATLSYSRRF